MAVFPLSSSAGCVLNDDEVFGDPKLIEGTKDADFIDCRSSVKGHDIYGDGGNDIIYGSNFSDFIAGGGGADTIWGGEGNDNIDGGAEDDVIRGEGGNDIIFGGVGSAPASGVGCELQTAFVAAGSSYLTKGGSGDDTIYGGAGNDCIDAGSGEDIVYGGDGNDTLEGGNHNDMLDGGAGDDHIDGGWHTDTCIGGGGSDNFISCELDSAPFCGDDSCDANESICTCQLDCGAPSNSELFCENGEDDDCDGYMDCDDSEDCGSNPVCDITCSHLGFSCSLNSDCCSNKCKGKPGSKTCK